MATKKKRSILISLFTIMLALCFTAAAIYYFIDFLIKPAHIKYPGFEIDIPPGYAIRGIDVRRYQRVINWDDVKDMQVKDIKFGFVFIKATEGIGKVDAQFRPNLLKAKPPDSRRGNLVG